MNQLNKTVRSDYKPDLALVVYRCNKNEHELDSWADFYIESHGINEIGQLMEGKPLISETIAGMVEVFKDKHTAETRIAGAIPACLLHYIPAAAGDYTLIWHRPACQKMMHFTDIKLKSGLAMVPPVLYVANASHLRVYALTTGKRPGPKSKVHAAPFHNVSGDGRVCLGSAKVKQPTQKTFENMIAYWEEMFWGSKFSAVHNDAAVTGGLAKLWRTQLRKPDQPFPMHLLTETKMTYQFIINGRK